MDRSVTVRFYEIQTTGDDGLSVEATLARLRDLPLPRRQAGAGDEVVMRLEHVRRHDGLITGDFTRVQTENLPSHPADDAAHPLPVDRLGYHSAFCFDPATQILALQFDIKTAVGRVCSYLARFAQGSSFSYLPVLRQDALERFEEETPTKLRIKVARVNQFRGLGLVETDFEQSLEQMGALFDAPTIEVVVSAKGRDGGLDRNTVIDTVRRYLGWREQGENVKAITAETDESVDPFNFLNQLLKYSEVLELPRNDPTAGRTTRIRYVRECFDEQRDYLRAAYVQPRVD
jgi:hypothetical protein